MKALIICAIITASIVFIWDYTGFVGEAANMLVELLTKGKVKHVTLRKPLGCSLCMTVWITLVILLCMDYRLSPMCLVFGWTTQYVLYTMQCIDMALEKVFGFLQRILR